MIRAGRLASIFVAAAVFSGEGAAESVSLYQIWLLGLEGNAEWATAVLDLEGTRLGLERAKADRGPNLSLLSRFTRYSDPHRIHIPAGVIDENPRDFDIGADSTYQVSLYLTQEIYTGGGVAARIATAKGDFDAGLAHRETVREDLLLRLTRSVVDLQKALRLVDVAAEERKYAEAHLGKTRGFLENHMATRGDLLEAQVRLAGVERKLLGGKNAVDLARARLNRLLGRPLETPLEPAEDLPFQAQLPNLKECQRTALSRRPELAVLGGTVRRSRGQLHMAKSLYRPKVSLFGNVTQGYDPTFLTSDTRLWSVGATLTWSLWDSGRRALDLRKASTSTVGSEARMKDLEAEISLEVLAAHRGVEEKDETRLSLASTREMVREHLRLARERYAEGLGRSLDVLEAQAIWSRTETEYQLGQLDAQMARAELLHSMGVLSSSLP